MVPSIITMRLRQVKGTCFFHIFPGKHLSVWCLFIAQDTSLQPLSAPADSQPTLPEPHRSAPCTSPKTLRSLSQGVCAYISLFLLISTPLGSVTYACLLKERRKEGGRQGGLVWLLCNWKKKKQKTQRSTTRKQKPTEKSGLPDKVIT